MQYPLNQIAYLKKILIWHFVLQYMDMAFYFGIMLA